MSEKEATNIGVSQPPKQRPTGMPTASKGGSSPLRGAGS